MGGHGIYRQNTQVFEMRNLLTRSGGRTDGRIYLRKILSEPKFPGCIGNQIFLPMVLH